MNVKNVWLKKHLQGQSHKVSPVLHFGSYLWCGYSVL